MLGSCKVAEWFPKFLVCCQIYCQYIGYCKSWQKVTFKLNPCVKKNEQLATALTQENEQKMIYCLSLMIKMLHSAYISHQQTCILFTVRADIFMEVSNFNMTG